MNCFPIFCISIFLVFIGAKAQFDCSENEDFTECVNPCNSCEQRGRCDRRPICKPGCDCKMGFFRNREGFCIAEHQCQGNHAPLCPENSVFSRCGNACAATCESSASDRCGDECATGCFCAPGFLKSRDGKCVRPEQCRRQTHQDTPQQREGTTQSSRCPKDAIFLKCGSACVPTCDHPFPRECADKCVTGCFCKPGFLKRRDEICVTPQNCKIQQPETEKKDSKCPRNAVFIECGSPCPPTCQNPMPATCREECTTGCFCKPGYLKSDDGQCVLPQNCKTPEKLDDETRIPKCPEHSVFNACGTACPPTCEDPLRKCTKQCSPGCICKEGFLKRKDGKCVPHQACNIRIVPRKACRETEEFLECGPSCPDTCENRTRHNSVCNAQCQEGCFCKKGLFRNIDDLCVPLENCTDKQQNQTMLPSFNQTCPLAEEEYLECGPTCPDTCETNKTLKPSKCPFRCVKGCFCKPGFSRTREGACVQATRCPSTNRTEVFPSEATPIIWEDGNTAFGSNLTAITRSPETGTSHFSCPDKTKCHHVCTNFGWTYGLCMGAREEECRCFS